WWQRLFAALQANLSIHRLQVILRALVIRLNLQRFFEHIAGNVIRAVVSSEFGQADAPSRIPTIELRHALFDLLGNLVGINDIFDVPLIDRDRSLAALGIGLDDIDAGSLLDHVSGIALAILRDDHALTRQHNRTQHRHDAYADDPLQLH